MRCCVVVCLSLAFATAEVYFHEQFKDGWEDRWVVSEHRSDYGKWIASHGKNFASEVESVGLQTSEDAKFYAISAKFDKWTNKDKDLVVQFTVKHEQKIDCGGGYIKLLPSTINQKDLHAETEYNLMFGPDICGADKRTQIVINHKGEKHAIKDTELRAEGDELTHIYTLVIHPDQTFAFSIDNKPIGDGSVLEEWDIGVGKQIKDPSQSKPTDWVDAEFIPDPNQSKPKDWDQPEFVEDDNAKKPLTWDDEADGEWEAPRIRNPHFKGPWKPKLVRNPAYRGEWHHPLIDNPDYVQDNDVYLFDDIGAVAIEIWQVKSGSIFDEIMITDSTEDAKIAALEIRSRAGAEKAMYDEEREKKKQDADDERARRDEEIAEMENEVVDEEVAAKPKATSIKEQRKQKLKKLKTEL